MRGEPAFPVHSLDGVYSGMTLRDYFAGQVIIALLSSSRFKEEPLAYGLHEQAYQIADAMLDARERPNV